VGKDLQLGAKGRIAPDGSGQGGAVGGGVGAGFRGLKALDWIETTHCSSLLFSYLEHLQNALAHGLRATRESLKTDVYASILPIHVFVS
jgi:hypothetical protein